MAIRKAEYWDPNMETMPLEKLKELQLEKLKYIIDYAYNSSPFYRRRFDEAGVKPEDIKTFDDFKKKVPIVRKDDLRADMEKTQAMFGENLAIPITEIEHIYHSSGTTGIPTFSARTRDEYDILVECLCRSYWSGGLRPGDVFINVSATFQGSPTIMCAAGVKIGASVIPTSLTTALPITNEDWTRSAYWLKPTYFGAALDAALALESEAKRLGLEKEYESLISNFRTGNLYGEVITPGMRKRFINDWGLEDVSIYHALSEIQFIDLDCSDHSGSHIWMDEWFIYSVDPDTGEETKPGEMGEIVITSLVHKASPIVNYGTEDLAYFSEERCNCGRTHPRVEWMGRTGWVVNVRGRKINPPEVQTMFETFPETSEALLTLVKEKEREQMDKLRIKAVYDEKITKDPAELKVRIERELEEKLKVPAEIKWIPYAELPMRVHKIVRIMEE
jgi:phenylacetate-CoA ligase